MPVSRFRHQRGASESTGLPARPDAPLPDAPAASEQPLPGWLDRLLATAEKLADDPEMLLALEDEVAEAARRFDTKAAAVRATRAGPPAPEFWRITGEKRVALGGVVQTLAVGTRLDARTFGSDRIANLRRAGVPMERVA